MNSFNVASTSLDEQLRISQRNSVSLQFARVAETQREKVALKYLERSWTFAELDRAITVTAARLRQLGLDKGDRLAVMGKNSDAFLILFFAASRAGLVHVPINFALTGPELEYLVADSSASAIIVDDEYIDTVREVAAGDKDYSVVAISEILANLQRVLSTDDGLDECLTYEDWDTAEETDL